MKLLFSFLLLAILSVAAKSQSSINFYFTTAADRLQHDQNLVAVIQRAIQQTPSAENEEQWRGAFWAMELMLYKTPETKAKLRAALQNAGNLPESFQKALLEAYYTLYPGVFVNEAEGLLRNTSSPAMFVRCAEYLLLSKSNTAKTLIQSQLKQRFSDSDFVGFSLLQKRLTPKAPMKTPQLRDLFSNGFLPGETVIYSLQRSNRAYPGLVLIRKGNGSFVKNKNGKLFHTAQLARAITNYPYYITNGNTPQGIFRWTGFDTSGNSYIGPTPNLQMVMPMEATPAVFFGDSALANTEWKKELYTALLPSSWKASDAIYESWCAGMMGRSEIIMHGTTINPKYYKGQSYFPQTPSLGCLCSYEEWNGNGDRTVSNQQKIVDALNGIGSTKGYVVVIDIDNKKSAVSEEEIKGLLNK